MRLEVSADIRNAFLNIYTDVVLRWYTDLARSTQMFGTLADPDGANNALSQVLYGLALR